MTTWKLCWLDLETGGFKGSMPILEIFARMTNEKLEPIGEPVDDWHAVVYLDPGTPIEAGCVAMHSKSGLLEECMKMNPERDGRVPLHYDEGIVGAQFLHWLKTHGGKREIFLAGSSIHFDRKFIARAWPEVDEFLHHRMIDVSNTILTYNMTHGLPPNAGFPPVAERAHRSQGDVEMSLELARKYVLGRGLLGPGLEASDAQTLRTYAASMWEAMHDNVDSEAFADDRDSLIAIAERIEQALTRAEPPKPARDLAEAVDRFNKTMWPEKQP